MNKDFQIIAGPCSVENYEQMDTIFSSINNTNYIRGGAYKPRTRPTDFQGLGPEGINMMVELKEKYNKKIVCEALSVEQLVHFDDVDIIQIGARNMQNTPLLIAAGKTGKTILLKRGLASTVEELLSSAEYIKSTGNNNIILCERGIRTFSESSRFTLDIAAIAYIKKHSDYLVYIDPSHAAGDSSLVQALTLAGVVAGCDGLIIEVHPNPEVALSDKNQQLTIEEYNELYKKVNKCLEII